MASIPSPPDGGGYTCEIKGFDNVPQENLNTKMPTPKAIQTPLVDSRADHSNTTRLPMTGPVVPNLGV